jgi:hypothetical protein
MEGLGRVCNVVPIAASRGLSIVRGSSYLYVCTGADTFTLTVASTFAGSYATPGNIISRTWTNTATNGSAAWVFASQALANTVVIGSGAVAFHIDGNSLPDAKTYLKVTPSGAGLVTAILYDLTVRRAAPNLAILSA